MRVKLKREQDRQLWTGRIGWLIDQASGRPLATVDAWTLTISGDTKPVKPTKRIVVPGLLMCGGTVKGLWLGGRAGKPRGGSTPVITLVGVAAWWSGPVYVDACLLRGGRYEATYAAAGDWTFP